MISTDESIDLHSTVCMALGDPKRIQILYALHAEPRHVTALAEALNTPQPTISRHLGILREKGLVTRERAGAVVVYAVAHPEIIQAIEIMRGILRATVAARVNVLP